MGTYAVVVGIQTVSRFPLKYSTKQNKISKITGKKRKKKISKTTIVFKQTHSDRSKIHLNGYSSCQI